MTGCFHKLHNMTMVMALCLSASHAIAEPKHGIAMYGDPALPQDFVSLPYANPDAPKGGKITLGEIGRFDSLNPLIQKGNAPWQLRFLGYETLMGRNWGESFSLYGLLAESIETAPDRSWVEFTLRAEARFSDGSPVTAEDVAWSYETLGTKGNARYHGLWKRIERIDIKSDRVIRFTLKDADPEVALLLGMRPILKKAYWDGRDFEQSGFENIPITSSPYIIAAVDPGRSLTLKRNPEYWGKDLPLRRGVHNLDEITLEYFADSSVLFEAFKAGQVDLYQEGSAQNWEVAYDFPAVQSGEIVKSLIPHQRPSGMRGFVMNTRLGMFSGWRTREALITAFNFEYINDTITGGREQRITSYFSNSFLGMRNGAAGPEVTEILSKYGDNLPSGALEGLPLPQSDGRKRNRKNLARALDLLEQDGWVLENGKQVHPVHGPLSFEILLRTGDRQNTAIAEIYQNALERLGANVRLTQADSAQYVMRTGALDFQMTPFWRDLSLSPGNEQKLYWGSEYADIEGTRNLMGVKSPIVDDLIDRAINAESLEEFTHMIRALDRVLMAGRYVIPFHADGPSRVAHKATLKFPETLPIYGNRLEFIPDVWWSEAQ
jgi:peptide/nickel transport system substrate-binding protein